MRAFDFLFFPLIKPTNTLECPPGGARRIKTWGTFMAGEAAVDAAAMEPILFLRIGERKGRGAALF